MKTSIVIPSYTNSKGLIKCLDSIVQYTDLSETEIVVVANGAPTEIQDLHTRYPNTQLLWFNEPLGYPKACNHGIRAAKGEYILLLNDDCLLLDQPRHQWVDILMKPMLEDPLVGLTGPQKEHDENSGHDFLIFFCVLINRKVFDSIGLLDESTGMGFGEDTICCIEAEKVGWKWRQVPHHDIANELAQVGPESGLEEWKWDKIWTGPFPIFHDAESTIGKIPESEDVLRKNRQMLRERYRTPQVNIERSRVIDGWFADDEQIWLAQQVKALPMGSKVLEIGSWHGKSSRAIADNLSEGSQVYCIDTWNGSSGEPDAHMSAAQREGDHAHQWWWCNLQEHIEKGRVVPVRMHSANAAETFGHLINKGEMQKFDLVFIDGDHSAEGIKTDVEAWLPLLKEGGLMCGHDYYKENEGPWWVHVRQFVEAKFPDVQKIATSIWYTRNVQKRGNVFDCFLLHNELDLLLLRLETLDPVVDRFVIAEGTKTHAGQDKILHFDENKERFAKYLHKISHIVVDNWPELPESASKYDRAWAYERHQRDMLLAGLEKCAPHDIIILGDADEIANPEAVANYKVSQGLCRLKQRMFYYYLNCENKEGWDWQKIAPYRIVKELTPCGIRYPPAGDTPLIESGGWHFSFLGDHEHIATKLRDYSHQEFNTPEIVNEQHIKNAMEQGLDLFGRDLKYEFVDIDENYPEPVWADRLRWSGFIKLPPIGEVAATLNATPAWAFIPLMHKIGTVTATISTKDRYFTTLPLAISAVANQTIKPDKLKIYDDGEQKDLREMSPFTGLLLMLNELGIEWEILKTPRQGQVANHQHALDNCTTDYLWRVDDDEIPTPNCLEELLKTFRDYERGGSADKVGAVAGLVHHPGHVQPLPDYLSGALQDAGMGSIQWFNWNGGQREVDHLYSTFLINVVAAKAAGGYPRELSNVGHREETIFSHRLKRAGYALIVTPHALTWHLRESSGGIRSYADQSLWQHDEEVFQSYLKEWGMDNGKPTKLVTLDCGVGDHWAFRSILPKLKEIHADKELILAVCYPEVFKQDGLKLISIAEAKQILGPRYDESSIYKQLWDRDWKGTLAEGMLEICR